MFLKSAGHRERHITEGTPESVHSNFPMGFHVSGQFAALCAGVRTKFTFIRFVSCVTSDVHCQVTAVLEHFPTVSAAVTSTVSKQLLSDLK